VSSPRRLGSDAEDAAAQHLVRLGWTLLARRWRGGGGEIDIAALDGEVLVIVEVKQRLTGAAPEEAMTPEKICRLKMAAEAFLREFSLEGRPVRFDLAAWDAEGLRLIQDAF
jgi:putative endonuclease